MRKKNFKHVGRALAKIAHSNPFIVFHAILSQIESYDNMIQPIIESLGFMTPLALDVLSYVLQLHLADTSRRKLQNDGFNVARWFQHLASFTGVFYRAYPQAELGYLVEFLLARLEAGSSLELLIFSELLARMGGCQVLEDLSDAQMDSLSGGETLRHEMLAFDKASKRAVLKLQSALCNSKIAIPLLALIAQQREFALFKGQMNHVKLLGQLFDRCQLVFVQLVKFLSRTKEQILSYLALLPNLRSLCLVMHFETQSALHASRPLMALAAKHDHPLIFPSNVSDLDDTNVGKICAWDPHAAAMKAAVIASLPGCAWETMSCELYLVFWSLSLYDIEVPAKAYEKRIGFLRARHGAALRDLQDPDKRKKEIARCLLAVDALKAEFSAQEDHHKYVLSDLEAKCITFLSAVVEDHRRSISEALLQHCIMPRVTTTPEDSLFCAKFVQRLHVLETPNFSSLQYFDRVVKDIFPIVYCATDHEARCLGIFLRATFEPLKDWRFDKSLFDIEAASKTGFSVAIGSPSRCSHDQYCTVFLKWYDKITKIMMSCLDQYQDHGRACLLVLIKLIGVYPVRKRVGAILLDKLCALKNQEDMKDVQAMAQRYHTLLSKYRVDLYDDSLGKRDGLKSPNVPV